MKKQISIPKSFELMGSKIKIEYSPHLLHDEDNVGKSKLINELILIQPSTDTWKISKDKINHAFYHEKVHMILSYMGEGDLGSNEKFVDLFAGLLYQTDKTSEYE